MPAPIQTGPLGSPAGDPAADRCRFAHIDLNSYFASVEQELHPELRCRPVAVVPTKAETTCCIAASYEAKALGIKTGTQVAEARRICPEIIFIEGDHEVYAEYNHRIVEAVERAMPVIAVASIDEMVCELLGREQLPARARQMALAVKQSIRDNVGKTLRCSIGLAPNRYLAKVASDMQKPDGLVLLLPSMLPHVLEKLSLRDLPGVGARTEKRLNAKGIHTMTQLLAMDRDAVHSLWGSVWGDRVYHWLRGVEFTDGKPETQRTLGHSHVLPPDLRNEKGAWAVGHKLLHKAAMRLRAEKFWCGSLTMNIGFALSREQVAQREREDLATRRHYSGIQNESWAMEARFPDCQDTLTLLEAMVGIWQQRPVGAIYRRPFYIGITLSRLVREDQHQLPLFADTERASLSHTMDKLNMKYGASTLHFGGMMPARDAAPVRIAFTQIPAKYGVEYL
jgi:DNA polymerase-4